MRYVSTRGDAPVLDFAGVLLAGLALDGGLYVPERLPSLDVAVAGRPYAEVAAEVVGAFSGRDDLGPMTEAAYATFDDPAVVPLRDLGDGLHLLELFHGPTLAFKDIALQLVGRLFEEELARRDTTVTIVGATSGDTGSAAIEACRDREGIELVMLHPEGRVSEVQRRQMTTVSSANVHNVAVRGTFDDCQDLVKAMFGDRPFRDQLHLAAVNSINWARVAAQVTYYVTAAAQVGGPVSFCVPTGNFGNVYAGHVARGLGVAVDELLVATNRNDILTRFVRDGAMIIDAVEPSHSPAMDIQVSSNFERLLFEALGRDGPAVAEAMGEFRATGTLPAHAGALAWIRDRIGADSTDEGATLERIRRTHDDYGIVVDPHTAVGLDVAARHRDPAVPMVVLATAHPAKFPDAVEAAIGRRPALPAHLADLFERPERMVTVEADLAAVQELVRAATRA
jgi:threonine synthase